MMVFKKCSSLEYLMFEFNVKKCDEEGGKAEVEEGPASGISLGCQGCNDAVRHCALCTAGPGTRPSSVSSVSSTTVTPR